MRLVSVESIEKFYKRMIDIIGAEPGDIRFSARDIVRNLDNIPTVPTFGKWISVKDKLPEEEGDYLTYLGYGGGEIAELYFDKDEEKFGDLVPKYCDGAIDTEFEEAGAVSHWMPLPELPKEV